MKIYLATDHAGFNLKEKVKEYLVQKGLEIEDCGAYTFNKDDDYPDFVSKAAIGVSKDPENSRGIILGGSGQAEMMVANKFKNVRCALFYGSVLPTKQVDVLGRQSSDLYEMIRLTREHNNANMLSIGVRFIFDGEILKVIDLWLKTPFSNEDRHIRRINKIKEIESKF